MSTLDTYRVQVPWTDPTTGVLSYEAQRWLRQVSVRIGGYSAPSTPELQAGEFYDAGIPEFQHEFAKFVQGEQSAPPTVPVVLPDDLTPPAAVYAEQIDPDTRIAALEAQLMSLSAEIEALKQGLVP